MVPDGWLQIIRGPRLPAAKWPRAKVQTPMQQKPTATVARQVVSMPPQSKLQDRPRRSPAEVRAVASTKIIRIQAAIASLGADDIEERSSLEAALSRAQRLLVIPPVDKRIEDTSAFIARAKKRIAAESLKIEQAEKQRQVFEEELAQAERDLECFQREAETSQARPCRQESQDPVAVLEAELSRARAELAQLKGADPDAPCGPSVKRPCRTGEGRGCIPPMPTLVPAELNMWLEDRHADLRDALLQGDSNRALELTAKLSDGVEQMVEMTDGMHP